MPAVFGPQSEDCQDPMMTINECFSLADIPRQGDLDGRGNLSARALRDFCRFFITVCIDQVDFMRELLAPESLTRRVEGYVQKRAFEKNSARGSEAYINRTYI